MEIIVTATPAVQAGLQLHPPRVRPVGDLVAYYEAQGYARGLPDHIGLRSFGIDQQLARRCRCHRCKIKALRCLPMKRGRQYRVVQTCSACFHQQEA